MHEGVPSRATVLLALVLLSCLPAGAEIARVVRTADELLAAIGSDRAIVLDSGSYRISRTQGRASDSVSFEEAYDGREVVISGVQNLTLRGREGATILAEPRYAFVLTFRDASGVRLEKLTIGHTEAGECGGGVIRLENSSEVSISDCTLYGSGTVGVEATDCYGLTLASTEIRDCTSGAVQTYRTSEIRLDSCGLHDNQAYPLLGFGGAWSVRLHSCTITRNTGYALIQTDDGTGDLQLEDSSVTENAVERFVEGPVSPTLQNAEFAANTFEDPSQGSANEWRSELHEGTGISLWHPGDWRVQNDAESIMLASPDDEVAMAFARLCGVEDLSTTSRDPEAVFSAAFGFLQEDARGDGGTIDAEETGPVTGVPEGLPSQTRRGPLSMSDEQCRHVLRLLIVDEAVYAVLAILRHGSEEWHGETVNSIVESVGWAPSVY